MINVILSLSSYFHFNKLSKQEVNIQEELSDYPTISILIPAHNEEKVIENTVRAMLALDYPRDLYEVIVINDNSSDNTGEILQGLQIRYPDRRLRIITTDKINGGKGKSNALNIGLKNSTGEFLVVYDADNTPEKLALKYLVYGILRSDRYGAVIGKFRTRNRDRNWLTRFINIETLSFQWLAQAGRWQLFNLCTIPGTNFIIRRDVIEELGGWDIHALAEDTDISFQIYRLGYKISFMPLAVTWEQEPETLRVWFKQRTRWVKGNIYVMLKNMKTLFSGSNRNILFDLFYFFSVYILFLTSVVLSDVIFLILLFSKLELALAGNFLLLWFMAYILFIFEIVIVLTFEKGESTWGNFALVAASYFTYSQLWLVVAIRGIFSFIKNKFFDGQFTWYKTERY